MKKSTSWEGVAEWYKNLLAGEGTYQKDVILPNLLRLLEIKKGETVLDLACGPGFFSKEFSAKGAKVIGADISGELIEFAKENFPQGNFHVAPADDLKFLKSASVDKAVIVLSIQNIENAAGVFKECARVLKPAGRLFLVLNHPAFRIPKESDWGWDPLAELPGRAGTKGMQYRRIDSYLSELKEKIQMHPSASSGRVPKPEDYTISFHRPLQFYFKAMEKAGFAVSRLEEWNSNRKSEPGPRAAAEDRARKEIPLFLFLEAVK